MGKSSYAAQSSNAVSATTAKYACATRMDGYRSNEKRTDGYCTADKCTTTADYATFYCLVD
jgi:hypothetical protein